MERRKHGFGNMRGIRAWERSTGMSTGLVENKGWWF